MQTIQDSLAVLPPAFEGQSDPETTYLQVNFRKDNQYMIFERRVQNIYDLLAYIGGFWKAIFAIGFVLSQLLGYEIFVKSVMKRLYFFEKNPDQHADGGLRDSDGVEKSSSSSSEGDGRSMSRAESG